MYTVWLLSGYLHKPRELCNIVLLNTSFNLPFKCIQSNFLSASPYPKLIVYRNCRLWDQTRSRRCDSLHMAFCWYIPGQQVLHCPGDGQIGIFRSMQQPGQISEGIQAVLNGCWIRLNIIALPLAPLGVLTPTFLRCTVKPRPLFNSMWCYLLSIIHF